MKGNIKKFKKVPLSLLLVSSVILSNSSYLIQAKDNTPVIYSGEVSNLTDEQLASLTNPILQQYTADASHKVWKMTSDTRLAILANQENLDNERLAEIVKLVNSEFMEKEIVSKAPFAMVYAQEKDAGYGDVLITIDNVNSITEESTSEDAYKIVIDDNGVRLTGASETAVLYGLRTIQNLMVTNSGLVYGTIIDYPDMAERRMHVDCARKYISKDWFIQQIREMSYLKMNALQMHFSENLGFRIECETDPAIVSDQYLTKDEVREILKEAKKYGIKVIPSFDSPGHVDQILKAHPEYGQISNTGTHFKSGLDITNPEAIAYIRTLYSEYMDLFEGCTDFHIGGDEYMEFDRAPFTTQYKSVLEDYAKTNIDPNATWKDTVANYINELAEFVHDRGFTPRIWNDGIYYGENSYYEKPQMIKMHDYIGIDFWSQMSWNPSIANLNTIVQKGHDTIYNFNASFFYYVLRNDKPTDGREQHSFDNLNADRKIFNEWTPGKFQQNTVADDSDFIKGVSLGIWCDNPNLITEDVITEDISDELRALATKSWNTSSNSIVTFDKFQENYEKLGNVAGFEKQSQLPDSGEILPAEDLGKVTLRYVSESGKVLKNDVVKYGTIGENYEFTGDDIYGYRLISNQPITGQYSKDGATYTFVYELYCDKTELAKEINNQLITNNYINETVSDYRTAYEEGKAVYLDETSEQLAVDQALAKIVEAKAKAVELKYYPLYVETNYPLEDKGYVSGYSQYQNTVKEAKSVLYGEELNIDKMKEELNKIQSAKESLMLPDGNIPTVSATDQNYSVGVYPSDKYSYDKMLDNDLSTKCWFNNNQEEGKEIVFTFPKTVNMTGIEIIQPSDVGADVINGADIQVSTDKENWITVGKLKSSELDTTVSFEKRAVRYVRILITEDKPNWYQIAEMRFTFEQVQEDNKLRDLIKEAEGLEIEGKTVESISNLVDALIEAQKAYAQNSQETEKVETNLRNAINALENVPSLDTKALEALVKEVETLDLNKYVDVSELNAALEAAHAVLENPQSQDEIMVAITRLQEAVDNLVLKEAANKIALTIAVEIANEISEEDLSNVVPAVVIEFKAALEEAGNILIDESASQEVVDASFNRLANAIQMLEFYKGDKTQLTNLVNRIDLLNKDDYTSVSWDNLQPVLDEAKVVLNNENALEQDVNEAHDKLVRAFLQLRLKPNKDILDELIKKVEKLNQGIYTSNTLSVLSEAFEYAKNVFANKNATQEEVTNAEFNLKNALKNLVLKETPTVNPDNSEKKSDNLVNTSSVKTGDPESIIGIAGLTLSLTAIAYLSKKKKKSI